MYGYAGEARPIYVDEQLTKDTFLLLKYTKRLKKVGVNYVWRNLCAWKTRRWEG